MIIKNGFFNMIGQGAKVISSLLTVPILINYLGTNLFGLLSWTTTVFSSIQLAEVGLSSGMLYFLSDVNLANKGAIDRRNQIISSGLIFISLSSLFVGGFLFFFVDSLIFTVKDLTPDQYKDIRISLQVGAVLIVIRILQSAIWAILQSQQRYAAYNVLSTFQAIANNAIWIYLAYLRTTYLHLYIYASLALSVLFTTLALFYLSPIIKTIAWSLDKSTTKQMLKYNLGVLGSNLGSVLFSQGDRLIVAHTLGVNTLAIYTVFSNIVSQINQFAAQAVHPILPVISNRASAGLVMLRKNVTKVYLLNIYISLGASTALTILATPILTFFLQDHFKESYIVPFQILCLIYGVYTLSTTGYYLMLGVGSSYLVMIVSVVCSISTLISIWTFSISFGLFGVVVSNVFFIPILVLVPLGLKPCKIPFDQWAKSLVAPVLLSFATLLLLSYSNSNSLNSSIAITLVFIIMLTVWLFLNFRKTQNNSLPLKVES